MECLSLLYKKSIVYFIFIFKCSKLYIECTKFQDAKGVELELFEENP